MDPIATTMTRLPSPNGFLLGFIEIPGQPSNNVTVDITIPGLPGSPPIPSIFCQVGQAIGEELNYSDQFAVQVIKSDTTTIRIRVRHLDRNAGWKQSLRITLLIPITSYADWPSFGFNARFSPHEYVISPVEAPLLIQDWSYTTGDDVDSSPAVANGVVYVGSSDHNVYALDAQSGAKLWSYYRGYNLMGSSNDYSSPSVANGVVYVGSSARKVYAFHLLGKTP
jgi:hypothetical protein